MPKSPVTRLPGTSDLLPTEMEALQEALGSLQSFFRLYDYKVIDTPILERMDLYLKKSGTALTSKLYNFVDQGGQKISLRPEFTASVLRWFLERDDWVLPLRWQYAGPVFRHPERTEEGASAQFRQFNQVGAELIGTANPVGDVEIISMACQGLGHLGVRGLKLTLADPGLISSLLAGFDLSERAKSFLIGNLPQLRGGTQGKNAVWEQAQELGLQPSAASPRVGASLSGEPTTQPLMRDLLAQTDPLGSRSLEEIMTGYLRKQRQQEDPARFRQALDFLAELGQVQGAPEPALQEAGSLLTAHHLDPELLRELRETIRLLLELDLGDTEMKLDFALVPELAYYSGIVFELHAATPGGDLLLGSGGRYDGLARALGAETDVPAHGFACVLERVLEALPATDRRKRDGSPGVLVLAASQEASLQALKLAGHLRQQGVVAQVELCQRNLEESLAYARQGGLHRAILVQANGQQKEYRIPQE